MSTPGGYLRFSQLSPMTTFTGTEQAVGIQNGVDTLGSAIQWQGLIYPRTGTYAFEQILSRNGAVFNGTTDDSGAIQNSLNVYSRSSRGMALFPPMLPFSLASGLQIYAGNYAIDFNGCNAIYTAATGYALSLSNDLTAVGNYLAAVAPIRNLCLLGPTPYSFSGTVGSVSVGVSNTVMTDGSSPAKSWATYTGIDGNTYGAYQTQPGVASSGTVQFTHVPSGLSSTILANTSNTLTFANLGVTINPGDAYTINANDGIATLPTADGIFCGAVTGTKTISDLSIYNVCVRYFRNAFVNGSQSFVNYLFGCKFEMCWQYGYYGVGPTNSGENMGFHGTNISAINSAAKNTIAGSGIGIYLPAIGASGSQECRVNGGSVDYSDTQIVVGQGQAILTNVHVEDNHFANPIASATYNSGVTCAVKFIACDIDPTESQANSRPYLFARSGSKSYIGGDNNTVSFYNQSFALTKDLSGSPAGKFTNTRWILGIGSGATVYPTLGTAQNAINDPIFASGVTTNWVQSLGTNNIAATLTITNAGGSYTNGTYTNVALTNLTGSGTGATANITIAGGVVTVANINLGGSQYFVGNTANVSPSLIGGTGSGMVLTVATTIVNSFSVVTTPTPPTGATNAVQMNGFTGNNISLSQTGIVVRPNDNVVARGWINVSSFTAGSVYLAIRWYSNLGATQIGTTLQTTGMVATTGGTYVLNSLVAQAPAGSSSMQLLFYGQAFQGAAQFTLADLGIQ